MKVLVVYDSVYGNTERVARAIAAAVTGDSTVNLSRAADTTPADLVSRDLLIVGSPTVGGRHTPGMQALIGRITDGSLTGKVVATFDTRMEIFVARVFGYAAIRIRDALAAKGARIVGDPEGFVVTGREGPLKTGELDRVAGWVRGVLSKARAPV